MPLRTDIELVKRRHPEWVEHVERWKWLLDSLEGGERYRRAEYQSATNGRNLTHRNLVRHKHEEFDYRRAPAGEVDDRNYLLRLERTPIPTYLEEAIGGHLSEIYSKEIKRETAEPTLTAWWDDLDGTGTSIDEWMADTVGPTLLALGQIDLYVDRPPAPPGLDVARTSRADVERYGLDRAVAAVVLPENMPWWRLDTKGQYLECLVLERREDHGLVFRHWTPTESTLYDGRGELIEALPHDFGRVPIERVFDRRKIRCRHIGQSRYEAIAEYQRESYNKESELILTNTTQAHPVVMAPEDYLGVSDAGVPNDIPIGPGFILPMKRNPDPAGGVSYEPWRVLDFPKTPAESIRADLQRDRDAVDRSAKMTKPAGAHGTSGTTVAQSGISKALDQKGGNALLTKLARVLYGAEWVASSLALTVLYRGDRAKVDRTMDSTRIVYPSSFNLLTAGEVAEIATEFQGVLSAAGDAPETETLFLQALAREGLPGRDDDVYAKLDAEIETAVRAKATLRDQLREAMPELGYSEIKQSDQDQKGAATLALSDESPIKEMPSDPA